MNNENITVGEWMTSPVTAITHETPVADAYDMMMKRGIRRLPVIDQGKLVGIVTLGDLREARPSPATSLSIYELNYLLARLTVGQVMTHNPFTVMADTPIMQAAKIMLNRKIGSLPVIDENGKPIGIITESDIFRMLIDRWDDFTSPRISADGHAPIVEVVAEAIKG